MLGTVLCVSYHLSFLRKKLKTGGHCGVNGVPPDKKHRSDPSPLLTV